MRNWGKFGIFILAAGCLAQDLHLKTRTILNSAAGRRAPDGAGAVHQIVQYDHPTGTAELESLLREGMTVVAALPDNALVVAAPGGLVRGADDAIWAGRMDPADKLSPDLVKASKDDTQTALVEFHADVTPAEQDDTAAAARVTLVRTELLQGNHALVTASSAALARLAQFDTVAYLFPADPGLSGDTPEPLLTCAGMLTTSGAVGQYAAIVHGWTADADGFAHLTYLFGSVTPKVPALLAQSEVMRALNEWAKVTNLTFQQGPNPAGARNVLIKFVSGAHGDAYPFDGPKNSLAHTFYPVPVNAETVAGDIHLDADESWHAGGDPDIYSVALHEAGHAIGLGHSDKPGDVMYPYYRSRVSLSANDVRSAQLLYGVPASSGKVVPTPPAEVATVPAVRLTVDTVPASTRAEFTTLTGTLSGGKGPLSVQWQTSSGAGGRATVVAGTGVRPWSAGSVPLAPGENLISISAFDSAQQSTSATVTITRLVVSTGGSSTQPVSIAIKTPAPIVTTVATASITLAGVSSGGAGIVRVTWQTSGGAAGVATGTNHWLAAGVPLLRGTNTIVVRVWDEKGSTAWASAVVIRR